VHFEPREGDRGTDVLAYNDSERAHATERECELEDRYRGATAPTKTVIHYLDIRVPSAHLGIYDDETYCPIRDNAQDDE
jgi:hypothetical protein